MNLNLTQEFKSKIVNIHESWKMWYKVIVKNINASDYSSK